MQKEKYKSYYRSGIINKDVDRGKTFERNRGLKGHIGLWISGVFFLFCSCSVQDNNTEKLQKTLDYQVT